jgi:hypothetical protein
MIEKLLSATRRSRPGLTPESHLVCLSCKKDRWRIHAANGLWHLTCAKCGNEQSLSSPETLILEAPEKSLRRSRDFGTEGDPAFFDSLPE